MKKIFTIVALCASSVLAANAQEPTLANSKLTDNWYIGANVGAVTPLNGAFFGNMRPSFGIEVGRYLTPVFGLGVEGRAAINTTASRNAIDQTNVMLLGKFNLSNLFGGYQGEPRAFEVVGVLGEGWSRNYYNGCGDDDGLTTKVGLELNFNLGSAKAWQFNIKPGVVWGMKNYLQEDLKLNKNAAAFEINAGFTYKFSCSNGTHNFATVELYNQNEVDALNARINELRSDNDAKNAKMQQDAATIAQLQNELNDCRNAAPKMTTVTNETKSLESVVTFRQGRSTIEASQLPNVERIATFLKNHKGANVVIKGFASPEGSAEINAKIAAARAEAVKTMLIKKYHVAAGRISAEGNGVGDMFSEPDWNRVSICTIDEEAK